MFKAHWSRRKLRCTHSMYILTRQVFLGRCNEVWFHPFPSPSFGFPFHPFALHILLFLLFSFMSFLASCPVISLPVSLAFTSVRALVSTRTSTVHLGFRSPGSDNEFGSPFVPVHLVPFSSQPRTPLSCLVLFSCLHLFVLGCAHPCTLASTLVFCLPSGRRVRVTLGVTGILTE